MKKYHITVIGYYQETTHKIIIECDGMSYILKNENYKNYYLSLPTTNGFLSTIVIAQVDVNMKNSPIGYYFDKDLWEPGRYFDSLVKQGKVGLYVYK